MEEIVKKISTYDAVGSVLVHDLTQIIPGEYKGPRFKKGHVVREQDLEALLAMGKKQLYVLEKNDQDVHEDDAAARIAAAAAGRGLRLSGPGEGKIEFIAEYDGLLKIDVDMLARLVDDDEIMFASIHENQPVKAGQKVAGTRVIPLYVNETVVENAEKLCASGKLIEILPLKSMKVGLVTTGSEVYTGKIKDAFGPALDKKFSALGSTILRQIFTDDDERMIAEAIKTLIDEGAELIGVTGGMSVDPDDRTPAGIRAAGGRVVAYGAPVLPGAMFMLAYIGEIPVIGLPGCVMYSRVSIFELIVPRILAGETLTRGDIKKLAHGGFCRSCADCTWPVCSYGKA
jgi:molybdopterin biosynthesis enzyme